MLKKRLFCVFMALFVLSASACNPDTQEVPSAESGAGSEVSSSQAPVPEEGEESDLPSSGGGYTYDDLPETMKSTLPFGNTRLERNRLWKADLTDVREMLPKLHWDLFRNISEEEFNRRLDELISNVGQYSDEEIQVKLSQLLISVGDANTYLSISGVSMEKAYPLEFCFIGGEVYVTAAASEYRDMLYGRVVEIGGVDIQTVLKQLTTLFPFHDEALMMYALQSYLRFSDQLYGLGIVEKKDEAEFTLEIDGGTEVFSVQTSLWTVLEIRDSQTERILGRDYNAEGYSYEYFPDSSALCFVYSYGDSWKEEAFSLFNEEMFSVIEEENPAKIVIDLRSHWGADPEFLNPFITRLTQYAAEHPKVKAYTLVGRLVAEATVMEVMRVGEAVPGAVAIGGEEFSILTGGGEARTYKLVNRDLWIAYPVQSSQESQGSQETGQGVEGFTPDVRLSLTIEDIRNGNDVLLRYALED